MRSKIYLEDILGSEIFWVHGQLRHQKHTVKLEFQVVKLKKPQEPPFILAWLPSLSTLNESWWVLVTWLVFCVISTDSTVQGLPVHVSLHPNMQNIPCCAVLSWNQLTMLMTTMTACIWHFWLRNWMLLTQVWCHLLLRLAVCPQKDTCYCLFTWKYALLKHILSAAFVSLY